MPSQICLPKSHLLQRLALHCHQLLHCVCRECHLVVGRFYTNIVAYFREKVGCEVTNLVMSDDGDSSGWTREGMFVVKMAPHTYALGRSLVSSCSGGRVRPEMHSNQLSVILVRYT